MGSTHDNLSRTHGSELMSSDWQCEEVDAPSDHAFFEMKEDKECMLTEFNHCNSKNWSSSVADANTSPETKEDCDDKSENAEEELTAWLLVLFVSLLLWTFILAKFL